MKDFFVNNMSIKSNRPEPNEWALTYTCNINNSIV